MEIWKDVKGYEGLYQVSNYGNVKGLKRGKLLKKTTVNKGYEMVCLCKENIKKSFEVQTIVASAFLIKLKEKCHVDHINEIKNDNRLCNLQYLTPRENTTKSKKNKTGYTGVYYDSKRKRFRALIFINNKRNHLGWFKTDKEASYAYQKQLKTIKNKNI